MTNSDYWEIHDEEFLSNPPITGDTESEELPF